MHGKVHYSALFHAFIDLICIVEDGSKLAQDDFASLAGRTPQTHGEHYKYLGNYLEIFQLIEK